jgi:hypothetical protein
VRVGCVDLNALAGLFDVYCGGNVMNLMLFNFFLLKILL